MERLGPDNEEFVKANYSPADYCKFIAASTPAVMMMVMGSAGPAFTTVDFHEVQNIIVIWLSSKLEQEKFTESIEDLVERRAYADVLCLLITAAVLLEHASLIKRLYDYHVKRDAITLLGYCEGGVDTVAILNEIRCIENFPRHAFCVVSFSCCFGAL